jgi:hypothetical protein
MMAKKKNTFWNNGWTIALGAVIFGFILSLFKDLITKEPLLTTLKSITIYTSNEAKKPIYIDSSKFSKPNPVTSPLKQRVDTPNNKPDIKHRRHNSTIPKTDTSKKIVQVDNSVTVKGDNNHIVGGTGNSVGVNGDVYTGVKQRSLTDPELQNILSYLDSKEQGIKFYLINADSQSQNLQREIQSKLITRGYKLFYPGGTIDNNNDIYNKISVEKISYGVRITIYPSSNVNQ